MNIFVLFHSNINCSIKFSLSFVALRQQLYSGRRLNMLQLDPFPRPRQHPRHPLLQVIKLSLSFFKHKTFNSLLYFYVFFRTWLQGRYDITDSGGGVEWFCNATFIVFSIERHDNNNLSSFICKPFINLKTQNYKNILSWNLYWWGRSYNSDVGTNGIWNDWWRITGKTFLLWIFFNGINIVTYSKQLFVNTGGPHIFIILKEWCFFLNGTHNIWLAAYNPDHDLSFLTVYS